VCVCVCVCKLTIPAELIYSYLQFALAENPITNIWIQLDFWSRTLECRMLQCFYSVGWATGKASTPACKKVECLFVGGDDLIEAFACIIAPVVSTTSIILSSSEIRMEMFCYRLTQVHLEKRPLNRRKREIGIHPSLKLTQCR